MKSYQATYILEQFVDSTNRWSAIFGDRAITFPLNQKSANNLMDRIAGQLSPENLHCDGEISHAEAERKYQFYGRVIKELEAYCLNNWLNSPVVEEYY
jgi:hypothetical protein